MGVAGLLNLLKSIQKPTHLRQFAGKTLGIDAYGWLHRGAAPYAADIVLGKSSAKYVDFAMHRVRMLIHFGVTPYLVFDGDHLPSKAATEDDRAERRREAKAKGMELLQLGKPTLARQHLQKAMDITPEMAGLLIQELKRNNIDYVVAPYEADAQLAYLEQQGIIDGILSEDSDLLVFGARTLLTKLDQYGECVMIRQADFTSCREISLNGWTIDDFRRMAILSGCDYLEGIPKLGLKTAYRLVRKCKTIERTLQCAQLERKIHVPAGYLNRFTQAERTFLYQWVYCPNAEGLVNLTAPFSGEQLAGLTYIGAYVEPEIAKRIASGQLNPMTKLPMQVEVPQDYKPPPPVPQRRIEKENIAQLRANDKKIDSFFTPTAKRMPLAELDPNSFKPSKPQQHLLDRYSSTSWTPVQAQSRSSASQHSGWARTASSQTRNIMSAPQPRKRQRLCAEDENTSADALFNKHDERSKFFSAATPKTTSLSKRRPIQPEVNIWSDDSIDEAMAAIPLDIDSSLTPRIGTSTQTKCQQFGVFKDKQPSSLDNEARLPPLQMVSQELKEEAEQAEDETPFTSSLLAETKSLRERSGFLQHPREHDETKEEANAKLAEPMTPPPSHASKKIPTTILEETTTPPETHKSVAVAVATVEETPLKDDKVAETPDSNTTPRGNPRAKGSEDLFLVPDSEADTAASEYGGTSAPTSPSGESPAVVRLDLSRFAFGTAATG